MADIIIISIMCLIVGIFIGLMLAQLADREG